MEAYARADTHYLLFIYDKIRVRCRARTAKRRRPGADVNARSQHVAAVMHGRPAPGSAPLCIVDGAALANGRPGMHPTTSSMLWKQRWSSQHPPSRHRASSRSARSVQEELLDSSEPVPPHLAVDLPDHGPGGALGTVLERSRTLCMLRYERELCREDSFLEAALRLDVVLTTPQLAVFEGVQTGWSCSNMGGGWGGAASMTAKTDRHQEECHADMGFLM